MVEDRGGGYNRVLAERSEYLTEIGGETGCRALAEAFYSRVARDELLRRLFPGKSLRCATEEFAAFLIQFLGGDEGQTQKRWWVSLRESHARFTIAPEERDAWLGHMSATLDELALNTGARNALQQFFGCTASYVTGDAPKAVQDRELDDRWREQLALDETIVALVAGRDEDAIRGASRFAARPVVFAGLLVRMMRTEREPLDAFVREALHRDPELAGQSFGGWPLLHHAAAAGSVEVVRLLLRMGVAADVTDRGDHTALYAAANGCSSAAGPEIVRVLIGAGANVNARGGVTRATPLHMAARRGHLEIARTLIEMGADVTARDNKGDTPLQRALNCRRKAVAELLRGL